jgi:hypothetical protein
VNPALSLFDTLPITPTSSEDPAKTTPQEQLACELVELAKHETCDERFRLLVCICAGIRHFADTPLNEWSQIHEDIDSGEMDEVMLAYYLRSMDQGGEGAIFESIDEEEFHLFDLAITQYASEIEAEIADARFTDMRHSFIERLSWHIVGAKDPIIKHILQMIQRIAIKWIGDSEMLSVWQDVFRKAIDGVFLTLEDFVDTIPPNIRGDVNRQCENFLQLECASYIVPARA